MQLTGPIQDRQGGPSTLPFGAITTSTDGGVPPALDHTGFATAMARLGPFEDRPFLAVAVSGGADSLALTLLADRWARGRGGRMVGLTVDHRLRPGSGDEARETGRRLEAHGIEHRILTWSGDKPAAGLQQRAREARYALLASWCREQGCLHLLTAHHRDDQAETVAMRRARRSGQTGLAAMPAIRDLPGLRLLRPLLGIGKERLKQGLRATGQTWIEDPSNADPAFTRTHLRRSGLDRAALAGEAERLGLRRQAADRQAAAALVRHAAIDPAGFATLDPAGFDQLPETLARDLLIRLLMTIGGRPYPPRTDALTRLLQAMRGRSDRPLSSSPARTLGHCQILMHRKRWLICREHHTCVPQPIEPGRPQCWDGRFLVRLGTPLSGVTITALESQAHGGRNPLISKGNTRDLPGVVKPGLPALVQHDRLIAIPHLGLFGAGLDSEAVDLRFCPRLPLAKAPFMPHISN